ncbi:hypothetical protein A9K55_006205 [Cordyceps militaris]|uniref:Uncharacterized protein n=1 Tax=Cordyceps militaris TaxID=73501 RepID=A0A2H4S9N5_CORMI|nr:hypothetical protein A9K55_006205 [Cordyceps militaris]
MVGAIEALRLRVGACANRRIRQTGLWPNNAGANPELHARDKLFNLMPPSRKKRPVASVPVGNKGRGAALVPRLGERTDKRPCCTEKQSPLTQEFGPKRMELPFPRGTHPFYPLCSIILPFNLGNRVYMTNFRAKSLLLHRHPPENSGSAELRPDSGVLSPPGEKAAHLLHVAPPGFHIRAVGGVGGCSAMLGDVTTYIHRCARCCLCKPGAFCDMRI